jgi:hypothetical protein
MTDPRGVFETPGRHVLRVGRRACVVVAVTAGLSS